MSNHSQLILLIWSLSETLQREREKERKRERKKREKRKREKPSFNIFSKTLVKRLSNHSQLILLRNIAKREREKREGEREREEKERKERKERNKNPASISSARPLSRG